MHPYNLRLQKEHQFIIKLKDGRSLRPRPMPGDRLNNWLSQSLIIFMGSGTKDIKFTPWDIARVETYEQENDEGYRLICAWDATLGGIEFYY